MKAFITVTTLLILGVSPLTAAEETKTWQGTWNNRKYGTSGPLKCVATKDEKGIWNATFTGKYKGDPFEYKTNFQSKPARGQENLSGKATVSGGRYQWKGSIKGNTLTGQYTSSMGYYGTFVLQEAK